MPRRNCKIADSAKIWEPVNLYGCTIGEHTIVGAFTEIGEGVHIGNNCKIEAHCFIPPGVTIEDRVFIGPGTIFCNDKYPRVEGEWEIRKVIVKRGASIGARCVILPGITIGSDAMVGAGSVVTKDVVPYSVVAGVPARKIKTRNYETTICSN